MYRLHDWSKVFSNWMACDFSVLRRVKLSVEGKECLFYRYDWVLDFLLIGALERLSSIGVEEILCWVRVELREALDPIFLK